MNIQPGVCTIKHLRVVINSVLQYAKVFGTVSHFHPGLTFAGKVGAYPSKAPCKTRL